jgi:hypothetical protein
MFLCFWGEIKDFLEVLYVTADFQDANSVGFDKTVLFSTNTLQ